MDINEFVEKFKEEVFEDADSVDFTPETYFKELDEYSSLSVLSIIGFADEYFDVEINGKEIREVDTVQDLYDLIASKK